MLITAALPYANGPLHIGHLLGYIQADVFCKAWRSRGHQGIHFVCADDAHGTPIALAASAKNLTPKEFIDQIWHEHNRDFKNFGVDFDVYHTTHSDENRALVHEIYQRVKKNDGFETRVIEQWFDPVAKQFLADRYLVGQCPKCQADKQYGDGCEKCGATYGATDLLNPISTLSGARPVLKSSEHVFFKLSKHQNVVRSWLEEASVPSSVKAKLAEWVDQDGGLNDWDISRDAPYFGFEIPDHPGKFFYVWFDAPIGYWASFQKLCQSKQIDVWDALSPQSSWQIHHFLGKDIINFHGVFWPALLSCAKIKTPDALHVNGYVTVNGEKLSKSRGNFITAQSFFDAGIDPDALRYYLASKSNGSVVDVDFSTDDFVRKVNSDVVGKIVNIASRSSAILTKNFDGVLADRFQDHHAFDHWCRQAQEVIEPYAQNNPAEAIRVITHIADQINAFVDAQKPWGLVKSDDQKDRSAAQRVCTQAIYGYAILIGALAPITPGLAKRSGSWLGVSITLDDLSKFSPHQGLPIQWPKVLPAFAPLFERLAASDVAKLLPPPDPKPL